MHFMQNKVDIGEITVPDDFSAANIGCRNRRLISLSAFTLPKATPAPAIVVRGLNPALRSGRVLPLARAPTAENCTHNIKYDEIEAFEQSMKSRGPQIEHINDMNVALVTKILQMEICPKCQSLI